MVGIQGCDMMYAIGIKHIKTNKLAGCYHYDMALHSTAIYLWL